MKLVAEKGINYQNSIYPSPQNKGTKEKKTGLFKSIYGLLFTLVLLPFVNGGLLSFPYSFYEQNALFFLLLGLLLFSLLWAIFNENYALPVSSKLPFILYGLFVLWCAITLFWSIASQRSEAELLLLIFYGAVFFLATHAGRTGYQFVGGMLLLAGIAIGMIAIFQTVFELGDKPFASGTLPRHTILGIYMAMLFMCSWGAYLKKKQKLLLIASFILLVALFISAARGAMLVFLLALPFVFVGVQTFKHKKRFLLAVGKTIAITLVAFGTSSIITPSDGVHSFDPYFEELSEKYGLTPEEAVERYNITTLGEFPFAKYEVDFEEHGVTLEEIEDIPLNAESEFLGRADFWEDRNIQMRIIQARVAYEMLQSRPLQGNGLNTFGVAYREHYYKGKTAYAIYTHNHYLQTAAETGLPGFLLLISFFLSIIYAMYKSNFIRLGWEYPGISAAGLAFLLHLGGEYTWNVPAVTALFFAICGLLLGKVKKDAK